MPEVIQRSVTFESPSPWKKGRIPNTREIWDYIVFLRKTMKNKEKDGQMEETLHQRYMDEINEYLQLGMQLGLVGNQNPGCFEIFAGYSSRGVSFQIMESGTVLSLAICDKIKDIDECDKDRSVNIFDKVGKITKEVLKSCGYASVESNGIDIFLSNMSIPQTYGLAELILNEFENKGLTASIGISKLNRGEKRFEAEMRADDALYHAMEKGNSILIHPHDRPKSYDSMLDDLVDAGVCEEDALAIKNEFEALDECSPTDVQGKNRSYFFTDKYGKKKFMKFVASKEEADVECRVNYYFSQHPVLKKYIAKGEETPRKVTVGDTDMWLVIQEDVRQKADPNINMSDRHKYLSFWMNALAELHVYGTAIMDSLGVKKKALSLTKEKDDDRVAFAKTIGEIDYDPVLRKELKAMAIENQYDFIHQDTRIENRCGQYVLDWGHAGRGHYALDIARVLSDYCVNRDSMSDDEIRKYLDIYQKRKHELTGKPLSNLDRSQLELNGIRLLLHEAQSAYLISKGAACTQHEEKTRDLMTSKIIPIEKKVRKELYRLAA